MKNIHLIQRQIDLLSVLVDHKRHGRLYEPFGALPTNNQEYVVYLRGQKSLRLTQVSDLDALCKVGYLDSRWNRLSNARLYTVNKAAIKAIESGIFVSDGLVEKQTPVLLLQHADTLRSTLKWHMAESMTGVDLSEVVAQLGIIQDAYYQTILDTAVITRTLNELGQQLVVQLHTAVTPQEKVAASRTIASFGEWAHTIYQMLDAS